MSGITYCLRDCLGMPLLFVDGGWMGFWLVERLLQSERAADRTQNPKFEISIYALDSTQ